MLAHVTILTDTLITVDKVEACGTILARVIVTIISVDLTVPALKTWGTGTGVCTGQAGHAGGRVLAGVGRTDVKVALELAVMTVEARFTLALVVVQTSGLKKKKINIMRKIQ